MVKDFMTKEDVFDELDELREQIKEEMEDEFTPIFEEMTTEIVEERIADCQDNLMGALTDTQ